MSLLPFFKAYDVRGTVPDQLNAEMAYKIGRAYVQFLQAKSVVVGHDVRHSCDDLVPALINGMIDQGADVTNIGLCGTEEVYYATFSQGFDGGIMVTASHNPPEYNGMKMVRRDARPISADTGLQDIAALVIADDFPASESTGVVTTAAYRNEYIQFLLNEFVDKDKLKPLKIVVNGGNGCVAPVLDALEPHLPFELIKLHHQPDGDFPHGVPNPMVEENRLVTAAAIVEHGADLGLAWDGDFDRCFFWDEKGRFLDGYYVVGLLAKVMLAREPGAAIVHDPRLVWNTLVEVEKAGGAAVESQSGHAFMKDVMREHDALYGGEMSAHHYFRQFAYCDNGTIPWLLIAMLLSESDKPLSAWVDGCVEAFPISGEINSTVADVPSLLAEIEAKYSAGALINRTDGLAFEYSDWRFNIRASNTEPVVRLNVETRRNSGLLAEKTEELLGLIRNT